ncbi:hypothetical protein L0Z11_10030 [Burkholderia multivorans]|uniref:hypothetical protein n=1 Tax=Burkholderia multivorans TaxID=87883 RepID=UPI0020198450|nr:hypothetical protein [Burkholderia multivorans]UQN68043.1 hypothetical protein L0Z45_10050 [Burkholderia multivorans]UQN73772.1 hypothetical protein L0Z11_10030 [Burkholderia multivorans]
MNKIKDGGPAFPTGLKATRIEMAGGRYEGTHVAEYAAAAPGMTLRDYFAGQALVATYLNGFAGPSNDERALMAYRMADAMLRARGEA